MIARIKILFFDTPESEREKIRVELLPFFEVESIIVSGKEEFASFIGAETPDIILTKDSTYKSELTDLINKVKKEGINIPILSTSEYEARIISEQDPDFSRRAKDIAREISNLVAESEVKHSRESNDMPVSDFFLREVFERMKIGVMLFSLEDLSLKISGHLANTFGWNIKSDHFTENIFSKVIREDKKKLLVLALHALEGDQVDKCEFGIKTKNNSSVELIAHLKMQTDNQNNQIAILGGIQDKSQLERKDEGMEQRYLDIKSERDELSNFIAGSIHDIRAPLSSLQSLIYLTSIQRLEEERAHYFTLMDRTAKRLDSMVVDLMAYFRNARTEIRREKIDFTEIVNGCLENLEFYMPEQKMKWIIDIKDAIPFYSDAARLKVICSNIISNAIKYSKKEDTERLGKITIITGAENVFMQFEDNGIGILEDKLSKIFDMFYHLNNSADSLGLGLYLVNETVNKLGGKISVLSKLNEGTAFQIQLPNLSRINYSDDDTPIQSKNT